MVLDRLADRAGWGGGRERDAARSCGAATSDLDLALVKPITFMNQSGVAVRKVLARDHVPLEDLLVVCDDFDLPFGRLRLREEGSAGGHNGLRSIVAEMGTQEFARLRVGIGEPGGRRHRPRPEPLRGDRSGRPSPVVLDAAADAVEAWARDGAARAANRWNAWHLPEPPTDEDAPPVAPTPDEPSPDGIRRSTTGWRRLLPRDRGTTPREPGA